MISFKRNFKSIVTAVLASTVIWFAISLQIFPDVKMNINDIAIDVTETAFMLENDLVLAENYELAASIQIEGKRYAIGGLTSDDFFGVLDLSNVESEGEHEVPVRVFTDSDIDFEVTSGAGTATVKIQRIASKELPITAKADTIRVVEGMQIDEAALAANPPTVTIRGEKSFVDSISSAEVHAVQANMEMLATSEVTGELILFNGNNIRVENPAIQLDNEIFTVTVPVHMVKTLPLDFLITNYPSNFNIQGLTDKMVITPEEITLSSPDSSIENLIYFDVGHIDLSDITRHMLNIPTRDTIAPKLPAGYKNISGEAAFSLQFTDVDDYIQVDFSIPADRLAILNKPSGYNVDLLTREIPISVIGPASYVQAMTIDEITISINLGGMQISTDTRIISQPIQYRIRGVSVSAWVVDSPQVEVSFTRVD
ncbi:MAG: hypothetical protein FWH20_05485 [Oscillospiraceae bacterium]|nr:hypothetical protein [Oscillospiraceae bacterium]